MTSPIVDLLQRLVQEVRLLRQVVDELREEIKWANNNCSQPPAGLPDHPYHLTSFSNDPADQQWPAKVNAVDQATLERLRDEAATAAPATTSQQCLFRKT